jgi:hypothetical protein
MCQLSSSAFNPLIIYMLTHTIGLTLILMDHIYSSIHVVLRLILQLITLTNLSST